MRTVKVRDVIIGEGKPKICVPIVGVTKHEIIDDAKSVVTLPTDLVEWRADWFEYIFEIEKVKEVLGELREVLGEIPILFTFRTAREGGKKSIKVEEYVRLNREAAKTGYVDLIDVETFTGDEIVKEIIMEAHKYQVKVIGSNHDFEETPLKEEIIARLCKMQEVGVDISKIAVMPQSRRDVLTLLTATEEMYTDYADRPIITMSMSGMGMASRFCGEIFGSALTFGSAGKISAPGQMPVCDLDTILEAIHENIR